MKLVDGKTGLILRLGAMIVALLAGQQAMAIGTRAGTSVENTATVDYRVGTVDQTAIDSNTVTFVVDRRVDFDLTPLGGALVPVTPGETGAFFDFLLTNDSNSELDFSLDLQQLVGGSVRSATDDADMQQVDYAVSENATRIMRDDQVVHHVTGVHCLTSLDELDRVLASERGHRIWLLGDLNMLSDESASFTPAMKSRLREIATPWHYLGHDLNTLVRRIDPHSPVPAYRTKEAARHRDGDRHVQVLDGLEARSR